MRAVLLGRRKAAGGLQLYYILGETPSFTTEPLNARAVYHVLAGKYEEAQRPLNEALGTRCRYATDKPMIHVPRI